MRTTAPSLTIPSRTTTAAGRSAISKAVAVFALEVDDDRVSGQACFGKHLRHLVVMARLENHDDLLSLELRQEIREPLRDQPARRAVRAEQDENAVARGRRSRTTRLAPVRAGACPRACPR